MPVLQKSYQKDNKLKNIPSFLVSREGESLPELSGPEVVGFAVGVTVRRSHVATSMVYLTRTDLDQAADYRTEKAREVLGLTCLDQAADHAADLSIALRRSDIGTVDRALGEINAIGWLRDDDTAIDGIHAGKSVVLVQNSPTSVIPKEDERVEDTSIADLASQIPVRAAAAPTARPQRTARETRELIDTVHRRVAQCAGICAYKEQSADVARHEVVAVAAVRRTTLQAARPAPRALPHDPYPLRRHISGHEAWHKRLWGRGSSADFHLPPPSTVFVWPRARELDVST